MLNFSPKIWLGMLIYNVMLIKKDMYNTYHGGWWGKILRGQTFFFGRGAKYILKYTV